MSRTIATWRPRWSAPAAVRAARAAVVMPGLFAFADQVIGNLQVATFAAFGSFATLVLVTFGGDRRQKLAAHLVLALTGSLLLTIGTAISFSTVLAATITLPVVFAVSFAGVLGPNAAAGVNGALLAYVLPAASPGTVSMIPDRLAGWWLASVVGTAAVLLSSPAAGLQPLRSATASLAAALASLLRAVLGGEPTEPALAAVSSRRDQMLRHFLATRYPPTGINARDQAFRNTVVLLEWCTDLALDAAGERSGLAGAVREERDVLAEAARELEQTDALLAGRAGAAGATTTVGELGSLSFPLPTAPAGNNAAARLAFDAQSIAVPARAALAGALVASGRVQPAWLTEQRERWFGGRRAALAARRRVADIAFTAPRHASVRSVWLVSSLRSGVALSVAVLVADLTSVQHGFWVVLGTLSVLRTNAAATGATALRALLGTLVGFVVGGGLIVAIGAETNVLWVILPLAVLVAAYAPETLPFAVGQAAFTVTVAIIFNLLVPVGWKVGVVRVEDVALGTAVSVLVGLLFWPRGLASVVADDLAESFRSGATYLRQAVQWAAGAREVRPPGGASAAAAGARLEEALRGFLAERGSKHIELGQLWQLVGGSMRLRLTALSISAIPHDGALPADEEAAILHRESEIVSWLDRLADLVGAPRGPLPDPLSPPAFGPADTVPSSSGSEFAVWICEYLGHLADHLGDLAEPARKIAEIRREPWRV